MVDEDHVDLRRQPRQNLDEQVQSGAARHRELRLLENNPNRLEQIISPSVVLDGIATAIPAGEAVANRQFANHGERHTEGDWGKPGGWRHARRQTAGRTPSFSGIHGMVYRAADCPRVRVRPWGKCGRWDTDHAVSHSIMAGL